MLPRPRHGPRSFLLAVVAWLALSSAIAPRAGADTSTAQRDVRTPPLWAAEYDGPQHKWDHDAAVAVSPDGSKVFVAGDQDGATTDYLTAAYDAASGNQLWATPYDGPTHDADYGLAIGLSPDGSQVFVAGLSLGSSWDYATVAYDAATGGQLWVARYDGPANSEDDVFDLEVSPDGAKVFVTGESFGLSSDYATVAYDAATGGQLWVARYDGPGNALDIGYDLAVSPDGSAVFVTGESFGSGDIAQYATVAYDAASGHPLWLARFPGLGEGTFGAAYAVATSPDGATVYVTGSSTEPGHTVAAYATVAYDSGNGTQLWVSHFGGKGLVGATPSDLSVSPDGSAVFVTGQTGQRLDYATIALDAGTGTLTWTARYNGPGDADDNPNGLTVSPKGAAVYVTGTSIGSGSLADVATIAYEAATGSRLWLARAGGAGTDSGADVAVSPDGSGVFVTGSVQVKQIGYTDALTIAYPA